ncbi:Uu.00g107290.m01.CDS01 [Anthostomella pinea]|uniref:Uu.00g107290.m01.CDS01 n=1 Tax=Anthostomella pinea TaxID=933095 RepID=A0AAI8V968_9PEZI|nr:Uu.00g107290.m01.CDS01 [Anthostomella pinea]
MAAASVLIPLSVINQNGGVLPPSALSQQSPRHGRSRGLSQYGKSAGGRGYKVVEDSDATVAKAVTFVLKRSVTESELDSDVEEGAYLICDADGWVSAAHLLAQPRMTDLGIGLVDLRRAAESSKARFTLRQAPRADASKAESYQVRPDDSKRVSLVLEGEPLTAESENLPEYVIYETSYQNYPLVIASGGIKRADGASHISFLPAKSATTPTRASKADVSIWVHLRTALEQAPELSWQYATSGRVVATGDEVPKSLWTKAVARRPDIGLLFEDGVVHKEIPEGLRGKGNKGRAKKGKGLLKQEGRVDSESDSVEDDM